MAKIGLVAGAGSLPIIFADNAKKFGDAVIAFGLKGVSSDDLPDHVEKMHWLEWGDFQKGLFLLAAERIRKIALLGKLEKSLFFKNESDLDAKSKEAIGRVKDKKDYSLLKKASDIIAKFGVEVMDPTVYLGELMPEKGVLTKSSPTDKESMDIKYASSVARELSKFDIGQTVVVKDNTVVALEAVEGTDETIKRAGTLAGGGFTVVKMARPDQDMRFDVQLVGLDTLKSLIDAGGRVLALEAKRTMLIDRKEIIELADEKNVAIVVI